MGELLLDEQSVPVSPAAGQHIVWPDSATSAINYRDDSGRAWGNNRNYSVADQLLGVADTYVTGSRVLVPTCGLQVGSRVWFRWSVSKTAAGAASPIYTARLGTAGTTADTSIWTHTGVLQTAIAEIGWFELNLTLRNIGASAVFHGVLMVIRNGGTAATGLSAVPVTVQAGAAFSSTWGAGQGIGLSINPGAASAWTVSQVQSELDI